MDDFVTQFGTEEEKRAIKEKSSNNPKDFEVPKKEVDVPKRILPSEGGDPIASRQAALLEANEIMFQEKKRIWDELQKCRQDNARLLGHLTILFQENGSLSGQLQQRTSELRALEAAHFLVQKEAADKREEAAAQLAELRRRLEAAAAAAAKVDGEAAEARRRERAAGEAAARREGELRAQVAALEEENRLKVRLCGVGLLLHRDDASDSAPSPPLLVTTVHPGGPADRSGQVGKGDVLMAIDGQDTAPLQMASILHLAMGPADSPVTFTLRRGGPDGAERSLRLVRGFAVHDSATTASAFSV